QPYLTAAIGWTHTLQPTTLNDVRFSSFRGVQQRLLNLQAGDSLGIPNPNLVGLPNFTVRGYAGLGDAQAFNPVEEQSSHRTLDPGPGRLQSDLDLHAQHR